MTSLINGRNALLGAASALALSLGAAQAEEVTAEGAASAEAQTLVEVGQADAVAINDNDIGTAAQHLAGMSAADIEGMEVFDENGDRVGTVQMVAQNENGGVFLIVAADQNSVSMVVGTHAVPLPRFDYDAEADALVMWGAYATTAATADPYGTTARLYTVLSADAEIPQVSAEQYQIVGLDVEPDQEDMAALQGELVINPAEESIRERPVEDIVGLDILDRNREDVGDIENVAYSDNDELFLIISLNDGILGIGDSERAVKLDSFDFSLADDAFVLMDTSKEVLEAMPEYDSDTPGYTIIESDLDWARFK